MNEIARTIRLVLNTLNNVDVRGRENLDRLLGCMQALEKAAAALEKGDKEEERA